MTDQPTDQNEGLPKSTEEELEKKRQHAVFVEQIKKELKTNPRYKEYFAKYYPSSVEGFISYYAERKAYYIEEGKKYLEDQENRLLRFETEGAKHLEFILKKKLFDFECLWRAEKVRHLEVEHSSDLTYWWHNIERCPFISPITEEEIDVYAEYVLNGEFDEYPPTEWEALRRILDPECTYEHKPPYPDFFARFDERFGTVDIIKLPDIRGPKEDFYFRLAHQEAWKKAEEERKKLPPSPRESRPHLDYEDHNVLETFIRRFEDVKLLRYFRIVEQLDEPYDDEELNDALYYLKTTQDTVPIEDGDNWREAVIKAWEAYHKMKLAEGIRTAYKDYLMRLENKVFVENEKKKDTWDFLRKREKGSIIEGRVKNGEPPDFNF
jgi:hypothetical protein